MTVGNFRACPWRCPWSGYPLYSAPDVACAAAFPHALHLAGKVKSLKTLTGHHDVK
ncbi:MAG: hypothetical protein J5I59_11620 [Saprospiraceae bacterium]|nr:hypothetical protein [Saprospiraceae bacterium]